MIRFLTAQLCEKLGPPWQGRMTCSGMVTDANCTFSCNPGYDLVGSPFRTCLPSSSWSGKQTSCNGKYTTFCRLTRSWTFLLVKLIQYNMVIFNKKRKKAMNLQCEISSLRRNLSYNTCLLEKFYFFKLSL